MTTLQNSTERSGWDALRPRQRDAITLLVEDRLTDEQIAAKCGVTRDGLARWKRTKDFDDAFHAAVADWSIRVRKRKFAQMERRVDAMNRQQERMDRIIEARAKAHTGKAPGSDEGLYVKVTKVVTQADGTQKALFDYVLDSPFMREYRANLDQIRDELGQKTSKVEHSGAVTIEDVRRVLAETPD